MPDLFLAQDQDNPHKWLCRCGTERCAMGTGYTDLVSYLSVIHPDEHSAALGGAVAQLSSRDSNATHEAKSKVSLWKPWTVRVHCWLQLIIHNPFPLGMSHNQDVQCHGKYVAVFINAIMKQVGLLTWTVEKNFASALQYKFAIIIDGWTEVGSYYL